MSAKIILNIYGNANDNYKLIDYMKLPFRLLIMNLMQFGFIDYIFSNCFVVYHKIIDKLSSTRHFNKLLLKTNNINKIKN